MKVQVRGIVEDSLSGKPIENAIVNFKDEENSSYEAELKTDQKGKFFGTLKQEKNYSVYISEKKAR